MKTPDEIKKGLVEPELFCEHCGQYGEPHGCNRPCGACGAYENADDAAEYIQQLEAERDAAVNDVSLFPECCTCKHDPRKKGYIPNDCDDCINHCNWQWRGGQKEGN